MTPFQSIIITLIGTLAIYSLTKVDFLDNFPFSFRFLGSKETEKSIENMCSNSEFDLVEFYKTTGPNYTFSIPVENDNLDDIAKKLFKDPSSIGGDDIKDFIFKSSLIAFIILFIILLILWIPFTCCICCKKCICIPKRILRCSRCFTYICFLFCIIILGLCFSGYYKNSSVIHGIYGLACSLLKIGHHLLNGDDYKVTPYWSGVTTIINQLTNITKNISTLLVLASETNGNLAIINDLLNTMDHNLSNEYDIRVNSRIYNPLPGEENIFPPYLNNYGPPSNETTILGGIQKQLNDFKPYTADSLREILNVIDLGDSAKDIKDSIGSVCEVLEENINSIDSKIGEVIDNFEYGMHEIDSAGRGIMNALFSLNIGLMIAIFTSLILMYYCKCGHCTLCTSWFFLYIFMLLSLVLGALFLILGLFVQNLSSGVNHYIRSIDDSDNVALNILNVCLNKDGLLVHSDIFPEDFDASVIDNIYSLEIVLNGNIDNLKMYNFTFISNIENQIEDFMKRPKYYIPQLGHSLNNIRKYTDLSAYDSQVNKDTPSYEEWEINKEDCEEGYKYMPYNNTKKIGSDKLCLVIEEWTLEDIKDRYKDIKLNNESINISEVIEAYYNSINKCISSNDELLSDIQRKNIKFNESIIEVRDNAINTLKNVLGVVGPFRDGFREIVGEGSIFNILNCNFFKRDFNKLLEELYDEFGTTFRSTSDIFFSICVFEVFMTLLTLIIIASRIKKKDNPEENDDNELMTGLRDIKAEELVD